MDDATISEFKNKVHAVLFSAGRTVDCEELGRLVGTSEQFVREAVRELKKQLEENQSPLLLTEESNGNAWKLTVRDRYVEVVKDVTPHTELEVPVLATLALIAWKQPMLQSEVIKRRSTVAYEHIAKLEELGFVSKEKKGRSFLLKPTGKFFDYFDLPSQEAVKKLFEEIEPRVQKIRQMSEELAQETAPEQKEEKKGKLGGLDVYEPPEAPLETPPEQKEEGDEEDEETKEDVESEEAGEEDEEKEKKVIDELFGEDEKKKQDEETEEETEEKEEEAEESGKEGEDEKKEDESEEMNSDEETEEEESPKPKKPAKDQKRKLPKELEEFAGKEERIGE